MTGREFVACAESLCAERVRSRPAQRRKQSLLRGIPRSARSTSCLRCFRAENRAGAHQSPGFCLQDCGDPMAADVGRRLDALRTQRKVADYDLDDNRFIAPRAVRSEILRTRRILAALTELREAGPSAFRAKVRAQADCSACRFLIEPGAVMPWTPTTAGDGQPTAAIDPDVFRQGMVVLDPRYGLGKIVALGGSGTGRTATIDFASTAGRQKLPLAGGELRPMKSAGKSESTLHLRAKD